jgi:hypothetical protein
VATPHHDLAKCGVAYDIPTTFLLDKGTPEHCCGYWLKESLEYPQSISSLKLIGGNRACSVPFINRNKKDNKGSPQPLK